VSCRHPRVEITGGGHPIHHCCQHQNCFEQWLFNQQPSRWVSVQAYLPRASPTELRCICQGPAVHCTSFVGGCQHGAFVSENRLCIALCWAEVALGSWFGRAIAARLCVMPSGMLKQTDSPSILVCTVSVFIQENVAIHAHSIIGGCWLVAAVQGSKLGGPQA